MVDTTTTPVHGYMEVVQRRDAAILMIIIQAYTKPCTAFYSIQWSVYSHVATLPNVSFIQLLTTVSTFEEWVTGVHMNNVESYWDWAKGNWGRWQVASTSSSLLHIYVRKIGTEANLQLLLVERHRNTVSCLDIVHFDFVVCSVVVPISYILALTVCSSFVLVDNFHSILCTLSSLSFFGWLYQKWEVWMTPVCWWWKEKSVEWQQKYQLSGNLGRGLIQH